MRTAFAAILACAACYAADTDNVVSITATVPTCTEGGTAATVTIHLDRSLDATGSNPAIEVNVSTSGTALPGLDYTALPASVSFPSLVLNQVAIAGSTFIPLKSTSGNLTLAAGTKLRISSLPNPLGGPYTVTTAVDLNPSVAVPVLLNVGLGSDVAAGSKVGVISDVVVGISALADSINEGPEVVQVVLNDLTGTNNFSFSGNPATPSWISTTVTINDVPVGSSGPSGTTPKPTPVSTANGSGGCGGGSLGGLILAGLFAIGLRRRRS